MANLGDVTSSLLVIFFGVTGLFFGVLLIISRWPLLYSAMSGLLVGLALSVWVQSQLFVWDFGVLDGQKIDWGKWGVYANAELVVWFLLIGVAISIAYRSKRAIIVISQGVVLLGVGTLFSIWLSSDYQLKNNADSVESSVFSFHKTNNKILIVLDSFQSDVFQDILLQRPEEVSFLRGFVFYPNTVGGYPTTEAALPLILTGKSYKNETPVKEWIQSNNKVKNIVDYYADKDYGAGLISMVAPMVFNGINTNPTPIEQFLNKKWVGLSSKSLFILDGGLFRALPTTIKPAFYDGDNWFFSRLATDPKLLPGKPGYDLAFLRAFEKQTRVASERVGEFKFYHYGATHAPSLVNEYFEYEKNMPDTRASYVRQARGVLILLRRKLERLKTLGIYDSAQIVVVGDHGRGFLPMDMQGANDSAANNITSLVLGGARPLLLYKPSNSTAPLESSNRPLHLADVVCILSNEDDAFDCQDYRLSKVSDKRQRPFLYYNWTAESWNKKYMPPMTEYVVNGDVRDIAAWKNNYISYTAGSVKKLSRFASYTLGDPVHFSQGGNASVYVKQGWGEPEPDRRWSDGPRSRLSLDVSQAKSKALSLRLQASAFPVKGTLPQHVDVLVNGHKIATWKMLGLAWYEASIPAKIVGEGQLEVTFVVSHPTAPCEVSSSKDCRKLGIAAQELVISEEVTHPVSSVDSFASYQLGDHLQFSQEGKVSAYVKQGWSEAEPTHRWTDGPRSQLSFNVNQVKSKSLSLRLYASTMSLGGAVPQHVDVLVNGHKVASWSMLALAWYEASIPAKIVANGKLDVTFMIAKPVVPCKVSKSLDCRKLGIAAQELVIDVA